MKLKQIKQKESVIEYLKTRCSIRCNDIRSFGRPKFYWVFKYGKARTLAEKIDRRKMELIKCLGKPLFSVSGNGGGDKWNGFNISFN